MDRDSDELRPPAGNCFVCQARERTEWCRLGEDELGLLNRHKIANRYEPGQVIFYQGNPCLGIHCIEEGTVALRKAASDGQEMVARLFHAGDTLGYLAYFAETGYTGTAVAVTPAHVCFIERTAVRELLARNPALGLAFLRRTAENLRDAEDARLRDAALPLRIRLAHLLLVFKDRFGTADEDGTISIDLPLSRQDIAAMLGVRPESLSRAIRQLERSGAARFSRRLVRVPDLDLLFDQLEEAG